MSVVSTRVSNSATVSSCASLRFVRIYAYMPAYSVYASIYAYMVAYMYICQYICGGCEVRARTPPPPVPAVSYALPVPCPHTRVRAPAPREAPRRPDQAEPSSTCSTRTAEPRGPKPLRGVAPKVICLHCYPSGVRDAWDDPGRPRSAWPTARTRIGHSHR